MPSVCSGSLERGELVVVCLLALIAAEESTLQSVAAEASPLSPCAAGVVSGGVLGGGPELHPHRVPVLPPHSIRCAAAGGRISGSPLLAELWAVC